MLLSTFFVLFIVNLILSLKRKLATFSMSRFATCYHVRFKCADGIQFEFDYFSSVEIGQVRSWCALFRDLSLPSVFKPCFFDVTCKIVTSNDDLESDFTIAAFRALSLSLRYPYLFNSKFYRYALKSKEK